MRLLYKLVYELWDWFYSQLAVIKSTILFYISVSSYTQMKFLTVLLCYFFPKVHKILLSAAPTGCCFHKFIKVHLYITYFKPRSNLLAMGYQFSCKEERNTSQLS